MLIPKTFSEQIGNIIDTIKSKVFDLDGKIKEDELNTYTEEMEKELVRLKSELVSNHKIPLKNATKDFKEKKASGSITSEAIKEEEYKIEMIKYEQKKFEREEIMKAENILSLLKIIKEQQPENKFFNELSNNYKKWFMDSQPIFGLYRSLQRGIFCPTSSMMDAMDNCSLKYNTTEPKEVGSSYSELVYEKDGVKISFGGVVLNYNQIVNGSPELAAKINYNLVCTNPLNNQQDDTVNISTLDITVSESNDLKARVAYRGVIKKIKEIYDTTESNEVTEGINYIKEMWKRTQYQIDPVGFNMLLSATAIKTMGDYLQECQACFKWGGYVNTPELFPFKYDRSFKNLKDKLIYRSVSKGGVIVPYDDLGNALRLGIQGDRPSGFRSIYILLNGNGAVNDQAITGYMFTSATQNPSRSLLVSRNMGEKNSNGLKGNVIFVTRELQVPDKNGLLKSLEFVNIKDRVRKVGDSPVISTLPEAIIEGSQTEGVLKSNPNLKISPFKNIDYDWIDYTEPAKINPKAKSKEKDKKEEDEDAKLKEMEKVAESEAKQKRIAASVAKKEASAAKKRAEEERLEYETSPEGIKESEELKSKEEQDRRTKIETMRSELEELQRQREPLNIPKSKMSPENKKQLKMIDDNIAKLKQELKKLGVILRGGTMTNKKIFKQFNTKRNNRTKHKLTRKYKKLRVPKKTRKHV
jgi:hypothetical protein